MSQSAAGTSRRAVLISSATAVATVLGPACREAGAAAAGGDGNDRGDGGVFEWLRLRWKELALGSGYDPTAAPCVERLTQLGRSAASFGATMAPASSGALWPDLPFALPLAANSAHLTESCSRLNIMAQAWAQPGTGRTGDAALGAAIAGGLDALARFIRDPRTTPYGNWWDGRIGSPRLLVDTLSRSRGWELPRPISGQPAP